MNFAIVGYGTVGRATRAAAEFHGHECVAVIDPELLLSSGDGSEPYELLHPDLPDAHLAFVCVGTPSADDGSCDESAVRAAVADLEARGYQGAVVIRSTVSPDLLEDLAINVTPTDRRRFLANPEFLRVRDIEHTSRWPNYVVIGGNPMWGGVAAERDPWVRRLVEFYRPYFDDQIAPPIYVTDYRTAALCKLASNALIAATVTVADELWELSRELGADWNVVHSVAQRCPVTPKTIRVDPGDRGFGGACLPKDIAAVCSCGRQHGVALPLLERVQARNTQVRAEQERERNHLIPMFGGPDGRGDDPSPGFGAMPNGQTEV